MFSISIFSILFELWLKMEIPSVFFKKRDFILSRSRARYHARKYSKCFERLTKNTISNIFKRYFILSMNYYLDSNHDVTMTHTHARALARIKFLINVIICFPKINYIYKYISIVALILSHISFQCLETYFQLVYHVNTFLNNFCNI